MTDSENSTPLSPKNGKLAIGDEHNVKNVTPIALEVTEYPVHPLIGPHAPVHKKDAHPWARIPTTPPVVPAVATLGISRSHSACRATNCGTAEKEVTTNNYPECASDGGSPPLVVDAKKSHSTHNLVPSDDSIKVTGRKLPDEDPKVSLEKGGHPRSPDADKPKNTNDIPGYPSGDEAPTKAAKTSKL